MNRLIDRLSIAVAFVLVAMPALAGGAVPGPVATPEPASMALLAAGIGSVAWAKFRKRK